MRITNSAVGMAAKSTFSAVSSKQSKLVTWVGSRAQQQITSAANADKIDISEMSRKLSQNAANTSQTQSADGSGDAAKELTDLEQQKIKIIEGMLYRLTGKHIKINIIDPEKLNLSKANISIQFTKLPTAQAIQLTSQRAGYGLLFDSVSSYTEKQSMSFQSAGQVQTADGRTIDFNVQLNMSREFSTTNEVHIRAGDAMQMDPLVINMDAAGPKLTQRSFSFDLDDDGDAEQISNLASGSGFLALDKNGDGAINNGSELFGPTMGNGFTELGAYDSDSNGWIDENDPVFDKLRIWSTDEQGNMQLFGLGEKGVGAIYLGNVASAFDINDGQNNSLGTVQSTGIFLKENGGAGTIQHIDLTV
jgi:hypothetical protein